jgi:hypothetical protein
VLGETLNRTGEKQAMARYRKGESGNPKGRPPGIKDKRTQYRKLLEPHVEELVAKAVELALDGDTTALRLCLERITPPIKAKDETINIGKLEGTLAEQGQAIIAAVGTGTISPTEAATMLGALASQARIREGDELAKRLSELEMKVNGHQATN